MRTLLICMALIASFFTAGAQHNKEEMIKYLTNGQQRLWIFKDYRSNLGTCSGNGQSFNFNVDGKLAWKRCVNGEVSYKSTNWTVTPIVGKLGEFIISFNKPIEISDGFGITSLHISFVMPKTNVPNRRMIWNMPDCKKCPEPVIELISSN